MTTAAVHRFRWWLVVLPALALLAAFVSLSGQTGDASIDHHARHAAPISTAHLAGVSHAHPDCTMSQLAGCRMNLCHAAISSDPMVMPMMTDVNETTVLFVVQSAGNGPAIILPPPRRLAI